MKILAIADKVAELIYGPSIRKYFGDVDLVLSCGDLPYDYLQYIVTMLPVPVFFVRGNHDRQWEQTEQAIVPAYPDGCINLHRRVVTYRGLLLAGLEGSRRYKPGPFQASESEMAWQILSLWPRLLLNRLRTGRYLDVLLTHAPPWGVNDGEDFCHRGFKSLVYFMDRFAPRYLIHGHVHLYGHNPPWRTTYGGTQVLNAFGYRIVEVSVPDDGEAK